MQLLQLAVGTWYRERINALKEQMVHWYEQSKYILTAKEAYSITSSYLKLKGEYAKLDIADLIWSSVAQPRHRFIMWLAVQGRLLTGKTAMIKHSSVENTACCLCDSHARETSNHLFVECGWSMQLRGELNQGPIYSFRQGRLSRS